MFLLLDPFTVDLISTVSIMQRNQQQLKLLFTRMMCLTCDNRLEEAKPITSAITKLMGNISLNI